jgi:hypothetical protein
MHVQYSNIRGKNNGIFFWESKTNQNFYTEINGNFIFDLRIFTLRTVFIERITFVNLGTGPFPTLTYTQTYFFKAFPLKLYVISFPRA